jgi:hypothetical protein
MNWENLSGFLRIELAIRPVKYAGGRRLKRRQATAVGAKQKFT